MVDGLIISKDKILFEELNINFSRTLTSFEYADSLDSAKNIIDLTIPDYLIIIEKSVQSALELINGLHENATVKNLPVICLLSTEEWSQRNKLWQIGVTDIVQLPISRAELTLLLEKFIENISDISYDQEEEGMYGKLEDYNLIDLIQTLESSKKTGVLVLYRAREEGKIWISEGNIHDAKYRNFKPIAAIQKMVSWSDGDFAISFTDENYEKLIEENNQQILLDAIQYIDQRNKQLQKLPDTNEILLISPEADMEEMAEEDVTYLRFFHGGQSISGFLDSFDEDDIKLLKEVETLLDHNFLMTREEFDSFVSQQEQMAEDAGIKNVFKKFFKRKTEDVEQRKKVASPEDLEELILNEDLTTMNETTFIKMDFDDKVDLNHIKNKIKKL
jgi:DNA-binding response OmpR family regulator